MGHPNDPQTCQEDGERLMRYTAIERRQDVENDSLLIKALRTRPRGESADRPKQYARIDRGWRA